MNPSRNIILIGFMASGKSHVGHLVAHSLGYELIDLDQVIERTVGEKINDIFATRGEAHFRELELLALKNLQGSSSKVIVSGGGTPLFFSAAQALKALGEVYFLDASFDLILARLHRSTKRPLGRVQTPAEIKHLRELYHFRRPVYRSLGQLIDVSHEDQQRTTREIVDRHQASYALTSLDRLPVLDACFPYEIFLGTEALSCLPELLRYVGLQNHKRVIITSDSLAQLLKAELAKLCADASLITIKDGEEHKGFVSVQHIHERLFDMGATRHTVVLAVGGGVVGDVAGFAASIYMRSLPVIQVPTTLLSMVDSSVGGKTGIDTEQGKNLIGSFFMPKAVLIDPRFLRTLPPAEYACGMAEIIKHAVIADANLFQALSTQSLDPLTMIKKALQVKIDLVTSDPYESNVRAYLNFGHTFAHAIEKVSAYRIKHGEAVAMGMVQACRLAHNLGVLEEDFRPELVSVLEKYKLPTQMPAFDHNLLVAAMKHDKKRAHKDLRFIVPKKIGSMLIQSVSDADIFG